MGKKAEKAEIIPAGIDNVWNALEKGVAESTFKLVSSDPATHTMAIKTGISLRSWGEKLEVALAADPAGTRVEVRSAAKLGTTLFDYGKNAENVEKVVALIRQNL